MTASICHFCSPLPSGKTHNKGWYETPIKLSPVESRGRAWSMAEGALAFVGAS